MPSKKDIIPHEIPLQPDEPITAADAVLPDPAPAQPTIKPAPAAIDNVLTLQARNEVDAPDAAETIVWHELQNSLRGRRILTGTLGGVERMEGGSLVAIVYYKGYRVAIPASEMMLRLAPNTNYGTELERQSKLLHNMMAAEIDFIVKGLDAEAHSVVASRQEAMLRKRRVFYFTPDASGQPQIRPDRVVQARIIAVAAKALRAEVFGVECNVLARDLSWDWIADAHERYQVGDILLLKILAVEGDSPENVTIKANAKSLTANTVRENLAQCRNQAKYAGTVVDHHKGIFYLRLANGVNAIAHSCFDPRMPGKGDQVSFAVTRIDEERAVAVGIITRIIRQII